MRERLTKYTFWITLFLFGSGIFIMNADFSAIAPSLPETAVLAAPQDTVVRFPVAGTAPETYEDFKKQHSADLRNPENLKTTVEYDVRTGHYVIRTRVGDMEISTPIQLTPEEYQDYSLQQSLRAYYRQKNEEEFQKETNNEFNLTDMQFDIGMAERIFGAGGVRVRTQGSADITLGLKTNRTNDPSLPERSRSRTFFNFDESVQLNVQASVGSKVNFDMNYNTETSFDFDSKKLKLAYQGEEDEIIKNIEAGNVSMTTNNSLIRGGAALFGMKADLQFGKLRVNTLFAQQESESKTVNSRGGVQTNPFEITVDQYDENRHYFLSHYFYDNYDKALRSLPYINSPITVNRLEVWITNKRNDFDEARNIVAFSDLGEFNHISNPAFVQKSGSSDLPQNAANNLYSNMAGNYPGIRNEAQVNNILSSILTNGTDYEKVTSARRLKDTEYILNKQLGYLSLRTQLQQDEVLAVAFEINYGGQTYQVGEFSSDKIGDGTNTSPSLILKLLKGVTSAPGMPFWKLMMKNVYSLNAYSVQKDNFKMDILYQSDTTGTYLNYIQDGNIREQILLRVMNLDRLNSQGNAYPDGFFDFLDNYTIHAETGRLFFPVVEPFGSYLKEKIGDSTIAEKYIYPELYDSTKTVAQQIAEKNKFILRGEYKASSGAQIDLGSTNVARGSVTVTAAGIVLTENVDYTVDYTSGIVTILNESIASGGSDIQVQLENQSTFNMQRKTMMGLDANYRFTPDFSLGATIMHMSEMPLTVKTTPGDESVKNTLWGLNTSYIKESQLLTNMLDKLPLLNLTKPSQISFNAEFAHLIAGHYENKYSGAYSYLDDFESSQSEFNLLNPYSWQLSGTPYQDGANPLFPEASISDNVNYGKNRALLSWYYIDGIFNRTNSANMPGIDRNEELSDHYVRAIPVRELYPDRDISTNEASVLPVLNVAYYPNERGPYNLDAGTMNSDGTLASPEKRWGGMMRKIEQSDFETANVQYIEFWLMDPFLKDANAEGGDIYFNLGEISEDILKDGKKFFENGLAAAGDESNIEYTHWGKVPRMTSTGYAFDNTANSRPRQDVGLNGLNSEEEKTYYSEFYNNLPLVLSPETLNAMTNDPTSPLNDPAGDNYMYYRDDYYESKGAGILERYKRYTGTEGNSQEATGNNNSASKTLPDVEDINQDNNLNETEKYFEYKVSLRRENLTAGHNFIVDVRDTTVRLPNGDTENNKVRWYLFRIPLKSYNRTVGSISDFKTIRFMRMYMTGFSQQTVLRFGSFDLVRGDWRMYEQDLSRSNVLPTENGTLTVSSVNIEENSRRTPVNYVIPPGVTRMVDPGQPQLTQENEQALSLKVTRLAPSDARAVYKNTFFDLRQYKRLQLFTHAESFIDDDTGLANGELSVFIRLGSDYKNNYYEYEVPLTLTRHGAYYTTESGQLEVWPTANKIDFPLEILTDLKNKRNKARREGKNGVDYHLVFSDIDESNERNRISIVGNPSLAEVKTIMIGIRNNSAGVKSGEIWVNELRLSGFDEEGGWAANANVSVALSDLGTVNASGRIETAGFGALDQSLMERRLDDLKQYSVAANIQLGKFFPEKAKVSIPFYYAYSKETIAPKYNPLDTDVLLSDALDAVETKAEKDSIKRYAQDMTTVKSIAFNNVKVDVRSKNPMPYDPANFSLGYSFSETSTRNPETEYETQKDYRANFAYDYTPYVKPFRPFQKIKQNNGYTKYIRQLSLNYLPSNISFQSSINRNYYEIQLKDLSNSGLQINPSFSQNFMWNRAFNLRWNLTNNFNFNFTSGTNARIDEPYVQINKQLNPDDYGIWKDSVMKSIASFGTPLEYDQSFQATLTLPFQYSPVLDWVNANVNYMATYRWERGATIEGEDIEIGNTIRNQNQIDIQGGFNFQNLYNKSAFLKKVNQKFAPKTATTANRRQQQVEARRALKVEQEVKLNLDSATIIEHRLLNDKVIITARTLDGKRYPIKYKAINFAQASILTLDTVTLKITVRPGEKPSLNGIALSVAEYSSRFLMMLRRLNVQYTINDGMYLPGFRPEPGGMLGQRTGSTMAPGLGFAFGEVRRSYIDEAFDRGWLVADTNNINSAMISRSKNLILRANLEPISGLKIDLNATRTTTNSLEVQFMYDGMPQIEGGTFNMTTIALSTAFSGTGDVENNYRSAPFEQFLANRDVIRDRLQRTYEGTVYPDKGFIGQTTLAGEAYNPDNGAVERNSADALIPAFIAAYTGRNVNRISLSAFPALTALLPNWRITYDGLIQLPFFRKRFKSFTLNHQYQANYSVGTFTTYQNWVDAGLDGLGFIRSVQSGNPLPSSPYEISSVAISERFTPLFGADATLLNNMTVTAMLNRSRNLSLNISSYQIVEALNNEIVVGLGYRITEFNKILKRKPTQNFSNDLNIRMDYSYRRQQSLIRKIEERLTQATGGNIAKTLMFSVDYGVSRALTLRGFYDLQINEPLISSSSFPTSNSNFGLSIRFSLTQ
ncbi:MAG: cell surface protein SprA [Tannerellaceae bacterium]|jgi:cell surface protein SprA|nr:cell surface protein SprA [Tannerellaceae bacterium]